MKQTHLIGIDGNEANVTHRVGSNVFAYELLRALEKRLRKSAVQVRVFVSHPPLADMPKPRTGWEYVLIPKGRIFGGSSG